MLLTETKLSTASESFLWKIIWRSKIPPRVSFFSWTAVLGKILSTDNLRKRDIIVMDWFFMYKQSGENVDYLLLHCLIALEMWSMVFCLFGIHWVLPSQEKVLLASWQGSFGRHRNVAIWRLVPHLLDVVYLAREECSKF